MIDRLRVAKVLQHPVAQLLNIGRLEGLRCHRNGMSFIVAHAVLATNWIILQTQDTMTIRVKFCSN